MKKLATNVFLKLESVWPQVKYKIEDFALITTYHGETAPIEYNHFKHEIERYIYDAQCKELKRFSDHMMQRREYFKTH